jgi:hypothetical protein
MLIVVLVVIFRGPESGGFSDFCGHLVPFAFQQADQFFDGLFLFFINIKDFRTVLRADIRSLAIYLGGVVNFEEQPGKIFIADFRWIETISTASACPVVPETNLLVRRMILVSADIARDYRNHAFFLLHVIFNSQKQPPAKIARSVFFQLLVMQE